MQRAVEIALASLGKRSRMAEHLCGCVWTKSECAESCRSFMTFSSLPKVSTAHKMLFKPTSKNGTFDATEPRKVRVWLALFLSSLTTIDESPQYMNYTALPTSPVHSFYSPLIWSSNYHITWRKFMVHRSNWPVGLVSIFSLVWYSMRRIKWNWIYWTRLFCCQVEWCVLGEPIREEKKSDVWNVGMAVLN